MKILVTGGAGFIGSHVVDRLLADGHRVAIVDNLSSGRRANVSPAATLHVGDIRSPQLGSIVAAERPDAVVHTAAQAAVARSVADPAFDAGVNVVGTANVLEAARRAGVRRIVYTSTGGAAYGYLECWTGLSGGTTLALRLANVYGPRQNPHGEAGVIAIFCHRLLAGEPCLVYGDGDQTRDYVFVEDVADAIARALSRHAATGIANIGTGLETTVNELYRRLAKLAGVGAASRNAPAREGEQRRSVLDATRAKTILGWTPGTVLDDGLARTLAWFKRNAERR